MNYPLLFSYSDLVLGDGFVATVLVDGRAILVEEGDDEVWMYGVNPGGLAQVPQFAIRDPLFSVV